MSNWKAFEECLCCSLCKPSSVKQSNLLYSEIWYSRVCMAYLSFVHECLPLYRIEFVYSSHSFSMTFYFFKLLARYTACMTKKWGNRISIYYRTIPYQYRSDQWNQDNSLPIFSNNLFEFRCLPKWDVRNSIPYHQDRVSRYWLAYFQFCGTTIIIQEKKILPLTLSEKRDYVCVIDILLYFPNFQWLFISKKGFCYKHCIHGVTEHFSHHLICFYYGSPLKLFKSDWTTTLSNQIELPPLGIVKEMRKN